LIGKDVVKMSVTKGCSFYREYGKLTINSFRGYCDLDQDWITCKGDLQSCKKLNLLRKFLLNEKKEKGAGRW